MNNTSLYEKVRAVPVNAKKEIRGGRLKGKTDINPMWRIKALTEQFGICGFGWKTVLKRFWLENGSNGVVSAFCEIELYVRIEDKWSEAIPGIGGSAFVEKETNGLYTSDECHKMAYTDAISVACKALGFGADVYWESDKTKYGKTGDDSDLNASGESKKESESKSDNKAEAVKAEPPTVEQLDKASALEINLGGVAKYVGVKIGELTREHVEWAIFQKESRLAKE